MVTTENIGQYPNIGAWGMHIFHGAKNGEVGLVFVCCIIPFLPSNGSNGGYFYNQFMSERGIGIEKVEGDP